MSKHKTLSKNKRILVYEKCNHRCAYCGCLLEYKDMQVDHIRSIYANNDYSKAMTDEEMYDVSNLLPACRQCNFYKSTMTIEKFRERLRTTLIYNLKKEFNYRLAVKYGLIVENPKEIIFYYENLLLRPGKGKEKE